MTTEQFMSNFIIDFTKDKITNCECHSHNCLTKRIRFYDFVQGRDVELKVCNGVVRLFYDNVEGESYFPYSDFVEYLIFEYFKSKYQLPLLSSWLKSKTTSPSEISIPIQLCARPCVYVRITMLDAFDIVLNTQYAEGRQWLMQRIRDSLLFFFTHNDYKKNKTAKDLVLRQLKNTWAYDVDFDSKLLDIANNILIVLTKNK